MKTLEKKREQKASWIATDQEKTNKTNQKENESFRATRMDATLSV